ncbi:MAG: ribosome biogenesis GTPase YlqF [Breznakia sp.]
MHNKRALKTNIQWFPGHMTKAKREMQEKLDLVDMVIEIRDARIPNASNNPLIDELSMHKPRLIILSKKDKADIVSTRAWTMELSDKKNSCIALDVLHKNYKQQVITIVHEMMHEKREKQRSRGINPRATRCMVCGIPNVGKSTFINRMATKKILDTADRPGVTKALRWVKISKEIDLLDTPGVLWPKFEDEEVGMLLAVTGAIRDQILPLEEVAYYALKFLKSEYAQSLCSYYNVELIQNNEQMFRAIALSKGFLKSGNEVDMTRTIETFLRDIRDNCFGPITWELCDANRK